MTIRKNLFAAGSVAAVAVVLAGCGSSGGVGEQDEVEQNTGEAADLTYWTWFPPEATLNAAIEAFEAEHPNISVELRVFEAADYQQQLPLALSGGEDIDVVGVQVSAMTNSVNDFLLPVDEWAGGWVDELNPTMVEQTADISDDGVLYSVPMGSIGSPIMYYNAEILDAAGVAVPTTAAEWKDAVDAISAADPDVTPVVFSGEPWWQEEMFFGIAEQTAPGLSDEIIGGDGSWDQPAVIDGLNAYKSLFDDGIVDTDVLSLLGTRPSEIFAAGEAAFYIDGSWQNSLLSESYRSENGIDVAGVGAAPLPLVDGGAPSVRALAEGGLGIPATSSNVDAAATFIEFMVSYDGADIWADDLVLVPSLDGYELPDSVLTTEAAQDGFAAAAEVIGAPTSKRDSQQDFLNQVEGNAILDVLRGTVSAEEAAARMQEEWTSGRYPHGTDQ
ncbi:extracellular solute-binding protein [Microbacterium sp. SSW1-59]|uniref:ABC transporter substrate-binding protein n=1 Tax=Microbacterium xanthum TaxID=3079794 RepID=UPI002AD3CC42|nr:extracellular solute-binding protein [Microbacterium sp. SSW1-59]MDZ8200363.1 extracellular solute-binding protein [Microbacterium sp. SSW1-59]